MFRAAKCPSSGELIVSIRHLAYATLCRWLFGVHTKRPQAAHLLRSWVRIPPGAWIFVCCECRVLSGRGLCDELITHPEESYRLCCVVVCNLETSRIGAPCIYNISCLRVNDLTITLLTWRKWWANNASKQQMGFISGFKGLMCYPGSYLIELRKLPRIGVSFSKYERASKLQSRGPTHKAAFPLECVTA